MTKRSYIIRGLIIAADVAAGFWLLANTDDPFASFMTGLGVGAVITWTIWPAWERAFEWIDYGMHRLAQRRARVLDEREARRG